MVSLILVPNSEYSDRVVGNELVLKIRRLDFPAVLKHVFLKCLEHIRELGFGDQVFSFNKYRISFTHGLNFVELGFGKL
jgi:hypothetical protein